MINLYVLLLKISKRVRQMDRIVNETIAVVFDDNRTHQSAIEDLQEFYIRELPEYIYRDGPET